MSEREDYDDEHGRRRGFSWLVVAVLAVVFIVVVVPVFILVLFFVALGFSNM